MSDSMSRQIWVCTREQMKNALKCARPVITDISSDTTLAEFTSAVLARLPGDDAVPRGIPAVTVSRDDLQWALKFMSVDGEYTRGVRDRLAEAVRLAIPAAEAGSPAPGAEPVPA